MLKEGSMPAVGAENNMLGVRVPPHSRPDVFPDASGIIRPESGGMSVNANWQSLPPFLIPRRFNHVAKDARGGDKHFLWEIGNGPFVSGEFAVNLYLRVDKSAHALVEPTQAIKVEDFQASLAATAADWRELKPEDLP